MGCNTIELTVNQCLNELYCQRNSESEYECLLQRNLRCRNFLTLNLSFHALTKKRYHYLFPCNLSLAFVGFGCGAMQAEHWTKLSPFISYRDREPLEAVNWSLSLSAYSKTERMGCNT